MNQTPVNLLLQDLKHTDETIRDRATRELWRLWFEQKGSTGLTLLRRVQFLMELGDFAQADELLDLILGQQPDFAEAWNRRAVLYYVQEKYAEAILACEQVIQLNPVHFGALHGLGLCHMAMGQYRTAIAAFRQALVVQPYSLENQRFLLECMMHIS